MMNSAKYESFVYGQKTELFSLKNIHGVCIQITNYGGRLVSITVPDKNGNFADIILGYNSIEEYLTDEAYMGAIVGRYADIIPNGCFALNGKEYRLNKNYGQHSIHGGKKGFDKVAWNVLYKDNQSLKLHYFSKDGEENYPGNLNVWATYTLTDANELTLEFKAQTDADTLLNLTSHPYFNLSGEQSGNILDHKLYINARKYAPIDPDLIAINDLQWVKNTPFDFYTKPVRIGDGINVDCDQLKLADGYDHSFYLENEDKTIRLAAIVTDPVSGRNLEIITTEPALHFYSGNSLDSSSGLEKGIQNYCKHGALCLEPQYFPYSFHEDHFPSAILRADCEYNGSIIYKFGIINQ